MKKLIPTILPAGLPLFLVAFAYFFLASPDAYCQNFELVKKKEPLLSTTKSGPYLGIQRGKYNSLELGYEVQKKAVRLIKPRTIAANIGIDYNLTQNIVGFSAGVWDKHSRIDFTYGGSINVKTDFDHYKIGVTPLIGYKISLAHLQLGYTLYSAKSLPQETNTLFISLRAVLINNRSFHWRKRKKKD